MTSKQQMHSLEQFLAQAQGPSVSWADVDDDLEMYATVDEPKAEAADHEEPAPPRGGAGRYRGAPPALPRSPPFVIYCGNLSFNCTEQNLVDFFAPLKTREIRLVLDPLTKRAKGFGYVEFSSRDDMERAFERNTELLMNRPIRIDVQASRNHDNGGGDRPQRHHQQPAQPAAPVERTKLNLKPRTVEVAKASDAAPVPKANPFGAARPREEVLKEKAKVAASTPTAPVVADQAPPPQQQHAPAKSSGSTPSASAAKPAGHDGRPSQKPAWGPVQSVLSHPAGATAESSSESGRRTPQAPQQQEQHQRHAWGPRGSTTPRSAHPDHSVAEGNGGHRTPDRHNESRPAGPNRHGLAPSGGHDRRGPVRQPQDHHQEHRRTGPRPHHHGAESRTGPRSDGHDHRPRHRHDDRKASRENTEIHTPKQAADAITPTAVQQQPRPASAADRHRSHSPSHAAPPAATAGDDAGFEQQRKGRRNGSGRNASSSLANTMTKVNLDSNSSNNNRKEKNTSGGSGNSRSWAACVQSPPTELQSSLSFSSNMFSYLANDED